MSEHPTTSAFESLWAEIKLLLEWQQGFGFYVVVGDDYRVALALRQRIEDAMRVSSGALQFLRPQNPETAAVEVLQAILPPSEQEATRYQQWQAPVWLDLTTAPDDPNWQIPRRQVLAALNVRRSALEAYCLRPLFVHLPQSLLPEVVTWAPDLWSIRQFIAILPPYSPPPVPKEDEVENFRNETIRLSEQASQAGERGDIALALQQARATVERFQQLRTLVGDTPLVLRDLSVILEKLGNIEADQGNFPAALEHYKASLQLRRQLRHALGDTPQVLDDLQIVLSKMARATEDFGQTFKPEEANLLAEVEAKLAAWHVREGRVG